MKHSILTFIYIFLTICGYNQKPIPAPKKQKRSILFTNATIHTGKLKIFENGAIGFSDGKIDFVGKSSNAEKDNYDKITNVTGKHIYPGFIAPNSTLGLQEIGAVRATKDHSETGKFNPNVRSIIAYNTDSRITPTVRTNGILLAQITPRSGSVSGTSSIVELDAWNWEDAVYKMDSGMHLNWPKRVFNKPWISDKKKDKLKKRSRKRRRQIRHFLKEAKAYADGEKHQEKDLKYEAMKDIFNGNKTLYVHVNLAKDIIKVIELTNKLDINEMVIVGGYDSWRVAEKLKNNDIPVILRRVHSLPLREDDPIDRPFKIPSILHEKGVNFCLNNKGKMEQMNTRNLPFYAGTTVAYGLNKKEALQSITLNAAKILGISEKTGSLEIGKDATLFISKGDALNMMDNKVTKAFIRGKKLDLTNHQKRLYKKFKKKYER